MGDHIEAESEWTVEQWTKTFNINVGMAYKCAKCGAVIMVTKGGVGVLEPICCGQPMERATPQED